MNIQHPNFYSVIIGTELLNGRRNDAHFAFLNQELLKRGWKQKASFVIEDDPQFMQEVFQLILNDSNSVMFCYGGIGATPDDYTRNVAAEVFTQGQMQFHEEAKELIEKQFGKEAYPHRINMAHLPVGAKLLDNVVNNVPGFYLQNRFFFMPGFPSMSQSMAIQALDTYYFENTQEYFRQTLLAQCGENELIPLMQQIPKELEFSSLPKLINDKRSVEISVAGENEQSVQLHFNTFIEYLKKQSIEYTIRN